MEIDKEKIDEAVLALLYLTLDVDGRAWKGFDFATLDRLHQKGYIINPVNKNKSVLLNGEGDIGIQTALRCAVCEEAGINPLWSETTFEVANVRPNPFDRFIIFG